MLPITGSVLYMWRLIKRSRLVKSWLKFSENVIGLLSLLSCESDQGPYLEKGTSQYLEAQRVVMLGMSLTWWEGWGPKFLGHKHIEPTCLSVNGALDHRQGIPLLRSHPPGRGLTQPARRQLSLATASSGSMLHTAFQPSQLGYGGLRFHLQVQTESLH